MAPFISYSRHEFIYGEVSRVLYLFCGRVMLAFSRLRFRVIIEAL